MSQRLQNVREPFDFIAGVAAHREASEAQHRAERFLAEKSREVAEYELEYRRALATAITTLQAEGKPATLARDLARGDHLVSGLLLKRMVAEGLREAAAQSIYRHTADRRDLLQFLEWSRRAAFLDIEPPEDRPEHR